MPAMQGVLPVLAQGEVDGSAVLAHPSELALLGDELMTSHRAAPYSRLQPTANSLVSLLVLGSVGELPAPSMRIR
jgi:hypothetical protein